MQRDSKGSPEGALRARVFDRLKPVQYRATVAKPVRQSCLTGPLPVEAPDSARS